MNRLSPWLVIVLLSGASAPLAANGLHPAVPLLDAQGQPVVETGQPLSTMTTCGGDCHDTAYIMATSDHADAGAHKLGKAGSGRPWQSGPGYFGGWNPLSYDLDGLQEPGRVELSAWLRRFGARHVGGGPAAGLVEMNCLLCHSDIEDHALRADALARGDFAWANTAPLATVGAVELTNGQWRWDDSRFTAEGALQKGLLSIGKPGDANCARCHGIARNSLDEPLTIDADRGARHNTERTGQLISPQKLTDSGLNLAGKEELAHPFDVHSARVVGCVNCHYSLNNPVYFRQRPESRPDHLAFDPRRLELSAYLERPLHQFAKGLATLGLAADTENTLRRCESCHEADQAHQWLPYRQRHFAAMACEACHVPMMYGPALKAIDWTMLDRDGQPRREYRNAAGAPAAVDTLIEGFSPVLLPRGNGGGQARLSPGNLVSSWYWVAGDPARPVSTARLSAALLQDGEHHQRLVAALDEDGDGRLSGAELRLDDQRAVATVQARLEATGLQRPRIVGEITPFTISHNVVSGRWATRECSTCHGAGSALGAPFALSGHRPPGADLAAPASAGLLLTGKVTGDGRGGLQLLPDASQAGFYVLGLHSYAWVDGLGWLMFLGVLLGVSGHALGRWWAWRRQPRTAVPVERVYMYDAYERLWHWLQAIAILLLLFTGLIIHKPHVFGVFSFAYAVRVHNVLGFILLINAALALFYNLASGEIRQYLPQPRGFIGRSIAQAMYYTRGIFAGQPHPIEKTREQKLNPLQQITYLGILNVLLPAQVVTGVLIWGLQRWPDLAQQLGGFQVLALVHTLVAWTFAAFIVMHVYLTTAAGHTPAAGIKAMIEGWDKVEKAGSGPSRGAQ